MARFMASELTAFAVKPGMVAKFEEMVYTDTIAEELRLAQAYLQGPAALDTYMQPLGVTVAKASCADVYAQFQQAAAPTSMSFSATLWMLDLTHRLMGIDKLDLARMRWAVELVAESGSFHKVIDGFPVAAESIPAAGEYMGLHKIERDADLDAVVLVVYWNRPENETVKHAWHEHLRDLHFKAQRAGHGAAVAVERFLRFDEEEKKRQVMGLSTFRRATELRVLLEAAESQRQAHECDAKLASRVLGTKQALQATWSEDTCRRYLLISERFSAESTSIMTSRGDEIWTPRRPNPQSRWPRW